MLPAPDALSTSNVAALMLIVVVPAAIYITWKLARAWPPAGGIFVLMAGPTLTAFAWAAIGDNQTAMSIAFLLASWTVIVLVGLTAMAENG